MLHLQRIRSPTLEMKIVTIDFLKAPVYFLRCHIEFHRITLLPMRFSVHFMRVTVDLLKFPVAFQGISIFCIRFPFVRMRVTFDLQMIFIDFLRLPSDLPTDSY